MQKLRWTEVHLQLEKVETTAKKEVRFINAKQKEIDCALCLK